MGWGARDGEKSARGSLITAARFHSLCLSTGAPLTATRSLLAHADRVQIGIKTWYARHGPL